MIGKIHHMSTDYGVTNTTKIINGDFVFAYIVTFHPNTNSVFSVKKQLLSKQSPTELKFVPTLAGFINSGAISFVELEILNSDNEILEYTVEVNVPWRYRSVARHSIECLNDGEPNDTATAQAQTYSFISWHDESLGSENGMSLPIGDAPPVSYVYGSNQLGTPFLTLRPKNDNAFRNLQTIRHYPVRPGFVAEKWEWRDQNDNILGEYVPYNDWDQMYLARPPQTILYTIHLVLSLFNKDAITIHLLYIS